MRSLALPLLVVAGALALTGCSDGAEPAGGQVVAGDDAPVVVPPELVDPPVPEGPDATPDDPPKSPPDREELRQKQEEWRAAMDEHGRGLVKSFESRVYAPPRDAELRVAEGVARVRVDDTEGAFRIAFDVEKPAGKRVTVTADGDVEALPRGTEKQIAKFAEMTLDGPYRYVVQYLPPIQLLLTYSKDREYKIVTAPPHKAEVQVSYRFDERELISHRGISVPPAAEITNYEWTFWRGRYLLSRFWLHGTGGTCDFEYDDRETSGVTLLRRALLRKEDKSFDVVFEWERVEHGTPDEKR